MNIKEVGMEKQQKLCANHLILFRKRMKLSQKAVSRLLGQQDCSELSRFERGHRLPPLEMALRLEIIYRTPVAFLFPTQYEQLRSEIRAMEERTRTRTGGALEPVS